MSMSLFTILCVKLYFEGYAVRIMIHNKTFKTGGIYIYIKRKSYKHCSIFHQKFNYIYQDYLSEQLFWCLLMELYKQYDGRKTIRLHQKIGLMKGKPSFQVA